MHKHPVAMEIDCQWTWVMKKKANAQPFQPSLHNFSYDPLTFCLWIISSKDHTKDLPILVLSFSSLEYKQLFKLLKYLTVNGLLLACCVYGTKTIQSAHEGYMLRFMDALTNCVHIQEWQNRVALVELRIIARESQTICQSWCCSISQLPALIQ
jgi:hypothetical protein